jgi:putative sigma-54 modulation protein
MRIDVVGRNLDITDPIRERAEAKADKLTRYYDGVQLVTVTITADDKHTRGHFEVEFIVDVPRHDDFVATAEGEDVMTLIDQASQKATRQLTDFKEKLKLKNR